MERREEREREGERKKEGERNIDWLLLQLGSNPQPFWCTGWLSNQLSRLASSVLWLFKKTEWIINICFLKIPTQTISLVIAIKYWGINNFLMQCFPEEKQKKASSPILFMRLVSIIEQGHYKKWELYDIIALLIY